MGGNSKCGGAGADEVKSDFGTGMHDGHGEDSLVDEANVGAGVVDFVGDIEDVCIAVILEDEKVFESGGSRN